MDADMMFLAIIRETIISVLCLTLLVAPIVAGITIGQLIPILGEALVEWGEPAAGWRYVRVKVAIIIMSLVACFSAYAVRTVIAHVAEKWQDRRK
jgi:uncharacterized BrkB/YihY/UPF0761 family membrane protein